MPKDESPKETDRGDRRGVPYVPRHAVDPASVPPNLQVGCTESFRSKLHIRKCSDVRAPFVHLEVSKGERTPPFMEVGVSLDNELCFTLWLSEERIELSLADFTEIYAKALEFLPEAIMFSDPVLDAEQELQFRDARDTV